MDIQVTKTDKSKIKDVDFSNLIFGRVMTDHMAVADYVEGKWINPRIVPFENISISPAAMVLHYGQAVFEGMRADRNEKGEVFAFRIPAHSARLNKSLERLAMPQIPEELFSSMIKKFLDIDREWIPTQKGSSLYVRPIVFATDPYVGLKPSNGYTFIIFASPSGLYYTKLLKVKVEDMYTRAATGGVGFAKAAGNYAASLMPAAKAHEEGFDQLLWTDGITHSFIEEAGTMNVVAIIDGILTTPAPSDTILAGITIDSLLTIAKDMGIKTEVRKVAVDEIIKGIESGKVTEAFGTGSAAGVAPITSITCKNKEYTLPNTTPDSISQKLQKKLSGIKKGEEKDTYGWVEKI